MFVITTFVIASALFSCEILISFFVLPVKTFFNVMFTFVFTSSSTVPSLEKLQTSLKYNDAVLRRLVLSKDEAVTEPSIMMEASEKEVIDKVIAQMSDWSASAISNYSHKDMPWMATKEGEEINYELLFFAGDYLKKEHINLDKNFFQFDFKKIYTKFQINTFSRI